MDQLLHKGTTSHSELDTIIGHLNHVAYVIPTARDFRSRICHFKSSLQFRCLATIPCIVQQDIKLWLDFLHQANLGISMNLLTYCSPTHAYCSNACEHGLGGFSTPGKAWRWKTSSNNSTRTSLSPRTSPLPNYALPPSSLPCAPVNISTPIYQRRRGGQG